MPPRYYQADVGKGVTNWTARPEVFPRGLQYIYERTGWLVMAHNRYWSATTPYAKQNGGKWDFLIDNSTSPAGELGKLALPVEQAFWDELLLNARRWGLAVYEQDWLNRETEIFPPLTESATLGRKWLTQMGRAAERAGLSIQYCMSFARHLMQSVEIPAVTQARASGDYQPGMDQWHPLGTTAIFTHALGVAASKDSFWSTDYQPGHPHYHHGATHEPHSRLQSVVLTLTKGPVAPSDGVHCSDAKLIMRSATADGTLLQPSTPAKKLDRAILAAALGGPAAAAAGLPDGEVWIAPSVISGRRFVTVFTARLKSAYALSPAEMGYDDEQAASGLVALEANATRVITIGEAAEHAEGGTSSGPHDHRMDAHIDYATRMLFTAPSSNGASFMAPTRAIRAAALFLAACDLLDFQLHTVAPREPGSGWALLGEVEQKWVAVSPARFIDISSTGPMGGAATGLRVTLRGAPGEVVHLRLAPPEGDICHCSSTTPHSPPSGDADTEGSHLGSAAVPCDCTVTCKVSDSGSIAVAAPYAEAPTIRCLEA